MASWLLVAVVIAAVGALLLEAHVERKRRLREQARRDVLRRAMEGRRP